MSDAKIVIFCDVHGGRRVPVAEFAHRNAGIFGGWTWDEQPIAGRYTGTPIVEDAPEVAGWAKDSEIPNSAYRVRHVLSCRRCRRPRIVRADRLAAVLDTLAANGLHEVSLTVLDASLERTAED